MSKLREEKFNRGYDFDQAYWDYFQLHKEEIIQSEIENAFYDDAYIEEIKEDNGLSTDAEVRIYLHDYHSTNEGELYDMNLEWIESQVDGELEERYQKAFDAVDDITHKVVSRFEEALNGEAEISYDSEESHSWSRGKFPSVYFTITIHTEDDDESIDVRLSDRHDNGRNDSDTELDWTQDDCTQNYERWLVNELIDRLYFSFDIDLEDSLMLTTGVVLREAEDSDDLPFEFDSVVDWNIDDDGTLTRYYGCANELTIPDYVKEIGNSAFRDCTSLTSITIPDSVNEIGDSAFRGCASLTSVTIPNSVKEIGDYAFFYCTSLTSVTIPNSVKEIGNSAFSGCTSLTSVTIPDSVEKTDGSAFRDCTSLTSITIPNSVTCIDDFAFSGCASLTSITIPNSVKEIGNFAFFYCTSLTSIKIPDSVNEIGSSAFRDCTSLTSITISNSVICIRPFAFDGCKSLTSITIPNSVEEIGSSAFDNCTSLTSITIPNSVKEIGNSAFRGCTSLTSVTIPDYVKEIGNSAFSGCTSLTSIAIPNSVRYIFDYAFRGCASLTSVTIPNSVTYIGANIFDGCASLKEIILEKGIDEDVAGKLMRRYRRKVRMQEGYMSNNMNIGKTGRHNYAINENDAEEASSDAFEFDSTPDNPWGDDHMRDKAYALAYFVDVDPHSIELGAVEDEFVVDDDGSDFNGNIYAVYTADEAEEKGRAAADEQVEEFLLGNPTMIQQFVDDEYCIETMREWITDDIYGNRDIDEVVDDLLSNGDISLTDTEWFRIDDGVDADDDDFDADDISNYIRVKSDDAYKEALIERETASDDDLANKFWEYGFGDMLLSDIEYKARHSHGEQLDGIDRESVIDYLTSYGYGDVLSTYDGEENIQYYEGEDYYIYLIDEGN